MFTHTSRPLCSRLQDDTPDNREPPPAGGRRFLLGAHCLLGVVTLLAGSATAGLQRGEAVWVSKGRPARTAPSHYSTLPSVSSNGRYIAFESSNDFLVTGDRNGHPDVFLYDTSSRRLRLISARNGVPGDERSQHPSISSDGRFVAFISRARNLVPNDDAPYLTYQVYVHDRRRDTIRRVSNNPDGDAANQGCHGVAISARGRHVAFESYASNLARGTGSASNIYVTDLRTRRIELISRSTRRTGGNDDSESPSISGDGRFVVFTSFATDLIARDANGWREDVFLFDRKTAELSLVSVASSGQQGNQGSWYGEISENGRYVAFASAATNLSRLDADPSPDIYRRDLQRGITRLVSISPQGRSLGSSDFASISSNGRYVAFQTSATSMPLGADNRFQNIFKVDLKKSRWSLVSANKRTVANGRSEYPSISGSGAVVAFISNATNLHSRDDDGARDIYARRD